MKEISEQRLHDELGRILHEVEAGERVRIIVDGRPIAEIGPVPSKPRTFVRRADVLDLVHRVPLDAAFDDDIELPVYTQDNDFDSIEGVKVIRV